MTHKLTPEQEALLAISLTCACRVKEGDLHVTKASVAVTESIVNGKEMAVDEMVKNLNASIALLREGIEEMQLLRNILRDERPPYVKRVSQSHINRNGHDMDLPRWERDPRGVLLRAATAIAKRREEKTEPEAE